ncbi:MAG: LicD family protein [Paramuribaculum sp.]|nr:LicD family protein [Paramuribaculum sp.]
MATEKTTELTLREKQLLILEIMKDIDRFCRDNNIPYTLSSGTLLGAVRHGGFIPWDDDADIFMLREDFDRFVKIYRSDRYKLIFNSNPEEKALPSGIAKVGDTTTWSRDSTGVLDFGVWVDVFPLESVPEDPKECKEFMHQIMSVNNRIYHRRRHDLISILKSYRHSFSWWLRKLDSLVHNNPYTDSPLVAHAVGSENYRTVIPRKWFDNLGQIHFEDHDFMAFSNPDAYLKIVYGADYMTPKKWSHEVKIYKKNE